MPDYSYNTQGAKCPHCGHLHHPGDDCHKLYDEDVGDFECDACGKTFHVTHHRSDSWSTTAHRNMGRAWEKGLRNA